MYPPILLYKSLLLISIVETVACFATALPTKLEEALAFEDSIDNKPFGYTAILLKDIDVSSESNTFVPKTTDLTNGLPTYLEISSTPTDTTESTKSTNTAVPKTGDFRTILQTHIEETSASIDTNVPKTADITTMEDMNLNIDNTHIQRERRDHSLSYLLQSQMREHQFQRARNIAKQSTRCFIERYKTVWTLQIPVASMSLHAALLHLPSVKLYFEQNQTLSRAQRLSIIKKLLDRMKSPRVLPNTVRNDRRLEEMTSTSGVLRQLNNLTGMADTMLRLLPNSGPVDVSQLGTSDIKTDIRTSLTILAAAHVILDQLDHL